MPSLHCKTSKLVDHIWVTNGSISKALNPSDCLRAQDDIPLPPIKKEKNQKNSTLQTWVFLLNSTNSTNKFE